MGLNDLSFDWLVRGHNLFVHTTDWPFSVMHIWSNLQVQRAAGIDPGKSFSVAKAVQLLTQMAKEGSSPSYGRYFNLNHHQKKSCLSQNRV